MPSHPVWGERDGIGDCYALGGGRARRPPAGSSGAALLTHVDRGAHSVEQPVDGQNDSQVCGRWRGGARRSGRRAWRRARLCSTPSTRVILEHTAPHPRGCLPLPSQHPPGANWSSPTACSTISMVTRPAEGMAGAPTAARLAVTATTSSCAAPRCTPCACGGRGSGGGGRWRCRRAGGRHGVPAAPRRTPARASPAIIPQPHLGDENGGGGLV